MEVTNGMFLPPEILIGVLAFPDIQNLKAIRQCNKLLSKEGAKLLFHTLIVLLQRSSFEHLRSIADHEDIRLLVRRICYVGSRYCPGLSMDQWRYHYSRGQTTQLNAAVWLQKPYAAYKQLAEEQEV